MPISEASTLLLKIAAVVPLLALTACAAISQGDVTYDGKPCNVLCQRWLGLPGSSQEMAVPAPAVSPPRRSKTVGLRKRYDDSRIPANDRHSSEEDKPIMPARFAPLAAPASPDPVPRTPSALAHRWGVQIPGSSPVLRDSGFASP